MVLGCGLFVAIGRISSRRYRLDFTVQCQGDVEALKKVVLAEVRRLRRLVTEGSVIAQDLASPDRGVAGEAVRAYARWRLGIPELGDPAPVGDIVAKTRRSKPPPGHTNPGWPAPLKRSR